MPELPERVERVLGWAHAGEEVEAYAAYGRETSVRAFGGEIESLTVAESSGIGVRVVVDGRQGFAYTARLDDEALGETLAEARDNAAFGTEDRFLGLAQPDGVPAVELDLWRDDILSTPTDAKVALALELEARVRSDPRVQRVGSADYDDAATEMALASTTGIRAAGRRSTCWLSAYAVAGEGADARTGWGMDAGRAPGDLDGDQVAADATERAVRLLGARPTRSRRLAVVFEPRVTATLLRIIGGTLSGEALLKGRSLFADRLGDAVAPSTVTLVEDPTRTEAMGSTGHDGEGLATRRTALIDDGVLTGFVWDTYTGRRAGRPSTGSALRAGYRGTPGPGCRALSLAPGPIDHQGILSEIGSGLLVTGLNGVHSGVNAVSGDFSVGAEGLLIRDGQLSDPVAEVTVASTLQRMLAGVVAVGSDLVWLPGSTAGVTLAIEEMTLSGS